MPPFLCLFFWSLFSEHQNQRQRVTAATNMYKHVTHDSLIQFNLTYHLPIQFTEQDESQQKGKKAKSLTLSASCSFLALQTLGQKSQHVNVKTLCIFCVHASKTYVCFLDIRN